VAVRLPHLFVASLMIMMITGCASSPKDPEREWREAFDRGMALDLRGRDDDAERHYVASLAAVQHLPDDARMKVLSRLAIARVHVWGNHPELAIHEIESLLPAHDALFGADTDAGAIVRQFLTRAHLNAEQYEAALPLAQRVLELRALLPAQGPGAMGAALNNVADALLGLGRYIPAIQLYDKALVFYGHAGYEGAIQAPVTMSSLAVALRQSGATERCEALHLRAIALTPALRHQAPRVEGRIRGELAGCYLASGRTPDAFEEFERSLKLLRAAVGEDHPWYRRALWERDGAREALH
jgi:tetratricopeptide (TPR) repeat protein